MLSEHERAAINSELGHSRSRSSAVIECLRIVQKSRGWISDEAISDIASHLSLTSDEVDGVATFYNRFFRKPVGRHVVEVCDNISCWVTGSDGVKEAFKRELGVDEGETTADGSFTLLPVDCLGACHKAPVCVIDGELYENLTAEKIGRIVRALRAKD